jgi:hypothetical protein
MVLLRMVSVPSPRVYTAPPYKLAKLFPIAHDTHPELS